MTPPTDKVKYVTSRLKHSLQDNNDMEEICYIEVAVPMPVYTIFPLLHWREIAFNFRHTTAKARVNTTSLACNLHGVIHIGCT